MKETTRIIGKVLLDLIPEAENASEALDIYLRALSKKIRLKNSAKIDSKEDTEIFISLCAYRTPIAEEVHSEYLKNKYKEGNSYA